MALANPLYGLRATFTDKCGKPLIGGKVFSYEGNSLTPKTTYTDAFMSTPNTNPVVLDETGKADIFLDGTYRFQVFSRDGVLIEDKNNVSNILDLGPIIERLDQFNTDFQKNISDFQNEKAAALEDFENSGSEKLAEFQQAIDTAAAAGAGANGWTAQAVLDASGKNQQEINDFGGSKWRLKAGGYDLNARVTLSNGEIVKSTVADNTVNPNVDMAGWMPSDNVFHIKAYGAKGSTANNEVDDGDAIIAAIQACSDAGGGEVFFDPLPSGMYYASTLRSQLTNINNVKINGNKQKLYTINPEITAKGTRSPFYINGGDNIEVYGFYFDGRYSNYVSKSKRINSHNFSGEYLSNVKIYHNVFANCGYPNDTIDEAGDSIYIIRNSHDIDIFENIFINPARWSISFQYNTADIGSISIRNNFQYITRPNKSLGFIDLEFSSSTLATQVSDILIENNTAYFAGYIAMSNASFKDVTIRNNKLKGYTYGANRVYKSTDYPYGFGLLLAPDAGRLPLENIEIIDNTFDSVNKQNIEITFQSKNMVVRGNKIYTQPDAPTTCGFTKGINIQNAIDVTISGNTILGTANQASVISLSVTNSTGSVHDNVAKHAVATSPTSFSAAASGELCVYDNYLETKNPTFQFSLDGNGILFWGNTTPVGTSGRIAPSAVVKFYGKNNTKLNANYNAQITNNFFAGQGDLSIAYASAAPNTGTWKVGDIVYNTNPSSGGVLGWSCVTSGTPGTWMPFGVLGVQKLTTANLQSATHAANTTNKFAGKSVINSTDKKLYYADGSAPTDVWLSVDGATTINPVA